MYVLWAGFKDIDNNGLIDCSAVSPTIDNLCGAVCRRKKLGGGVFFGRRHLAECPNQLYKVPLKTWPTVERVYQSQYYYNVYNENEGEQRKNASTTHHVVRHHVPTHTRVHAYHGTRVRTRVRTRVLGCTRVPTHTHAHTHTRARVGCHGRLVVAGGPRARTKRAVC